MTEACSSGRRCRASRSLINRFVQEKQAWIESQQEHFRRNPPPEAKKYAPGEQFSYLGKAYGLKIVPNAAPTLVLDEEFLLSAAAQPRARQVFEAWYRRQGGLLFNERVQHYASHLGLRYQRLRISSARTRWGSCSSRGTLSFTWRLVMAPIEVIDYVVVHELVHLEIPNHSKQFWQRLEQILPDYQARRDWLKTNSTNHYFSL